MRATVTGPDGVVRELTLTVTSGYGVYGWWEANGECFERINDGIAYRRPDLDWGTTDGDLVVAPWIQALLKEPK